MSEFLPSSIDVGTVAVGTFDYAEQEAAAVCVARVLADNEFGWYAEFSWEEVTKWVNSNASRLNRAYRTLLEIYGDDFLTNGMHGLVGSDHILRRDEGGATFFTVTPAFVAAMKRLAG